MRVDARFLKGLSLFNEGEYYECHEVIEELWLETPSEDPFRNLYKGVIQAAAAIYQFDRGILTGARGLYATCIPYLEAYLPVSMGLNVKKLVDELKDSFSVLQEWDGKSAPLRDRTKTPVLEYSI
jgi:uncharacterized protein